MVAFATLVLGLVVGEVRLELLVADAVAAVEVQLDGAPCARVEGPPWVATCDLGRELAPHRLTAVARDATGGELGRAEQTVNTHQPDGEIALVVEHDPERGGVLRIATASTEAERPRSLTVSVDGVELAVEDPAAVPLPPLDLVEPHLVRVEARWSERVAAAADAVLGGEYGDRLTTDLTAVPLPVAGGGTPAPAAAAGAVRRESWPLRVAAVERGAAELWVVADPAALPKLARLASPARRSVSFRGGQAAVGGADWRFVGRLDPGDWLRFVWPWPERRSARGVAHEMFRPSPAMASREGGLPWLLYHLPLPPHESEPPRLADAVAVAGMTLSGLDRRRAVLLVLDEAAPDASRLAPRVVADYLVRLRVPLHVWRLEPWSGAGDDPWPDAEMVRNRQRLARALGELEATLEGQRIAWVEGSHLPTELAVTASPLVAAGGKGRREVTRDGEPAPVGDAFAAARQRQAAARRAALDAALGGDGPSATASGLELRAAPGAPFGVAELQAIVAGGLARRERELALPAPELGGAVLAVVERLADHPQLADSVAGLEARGHAAAGVAVLESAGRPAEDVEALVLHELSHLVNERGFERPLPVWIEEGLAEHLARRRLEAPPDGEAAAPRRGSIVVEEGANGTVAHARGPLADLVALARSAGSGDALPPLAEWTALSWREFVAPERRARHYALAGELVGFLLAADRERAATLRALLAAASTDRSIDLGLAIAEALGDAEGLDAEFRAWLIGERDRVLGEAAQATAP